MQLLPVFPLPQDFKNVRVNSGHACHCKAYISGTLHYANNENRNAVGGGVLAFGVAGLHLMGSTDNGALTLSLLQAPKKRQKEMQPVLGRRGKAKKEEPEHLLSLVNSQFRAPAP